VYTVVVKNSKRRELCFGFWYQPMRISGGGTVEHKPYPSILEQEGRAKKWVKKTITFILLLLNSRHFIIFDKI